MDDELTENKPAEETADDPVMALAHVIAVAFQELVGEAHQHQWDFMGIWNPEGRPVHPRLLGNQATTVVLMHCKTCNWPETIELHGIWTIEQVRGQATEKPASDDQ